MRKISEVINEDNTLFEITKLSKPVPRLVPKSEAAKRNYKSEAKAAQLSLYGDFIDYRLQRNSGIAPQLVQIAQCMILCGLPYRATNETRIMRSARMGDGSRVNVTFHALASDSKGVAIPMPYGADRTLLHYGIDQAVKLRSRFVRFDNPSSILEALGRTKSGKNYSRLRDTIRRLSGLSIVVERFRPGRYGDDETRQIVPVLDAAHIPSRLDSNTALSMATPPGICFGERFFGDISEHHVPFPWNLLLLLEQKPQMQDMILFLHWRSFASKEESKIRWDLLREQIWHEDKQLRRIRERFASAIQLLKVAWPELSAEATSYGLSIGPPRNASHLIPALPPTTATAR